LLCAGAELDPRFPQFFAERNGHTGVGSPTFALAHATWDGASWEALTPDAPLRRWALVSIGSSDSLLRAPLALDERIFFYLLGIPAEDGRLMEVTQRLPVQAKLSSLQQQLVADISVFLGTPSQSALLQVFGSRMSERRDAIVASSDMVARPLRAIRLASMLKHPLRETMAMLLEREAKLTNSILYIETEGHEQLWEESKAISTQLACDLVISTRQPMSTGSRTCIRVELEPDGLTDLRERWHKAFGPVSPQMAASIDRVATHFSLDSDDIESVRQSMSSHLASTSTEGLDSLLWTATRRQARRSLDNLAHRVISSATWDDLVLPEQKLAILHDMVAQVAHRSRVYGDWGFATKCSRGLGITSLFSGDSGTGKTLAAEVVANQLGLDLYRIDLSQVVSKYIGESEKNLNRVFDSADACGAVLLFDEADALFGRRSEVKDSHDRYANIEVSFLLQRMEAYRGLAILTTNRKSALDTAFTRRIRFIIDFPFPDANQRSAIWRRAFPQGTPTEGLSHERLGKLNVTGGQIANIALHSAFLAADERKSVDLGHILRAAKHEFAKIERPFAEFDWMDTGEQACPSQ
jgi:AAA+ superfamily predicted ATPase